ncbi:uncharacterized protein LOC123311582 isoform X2 [Coccinella septempunctata]|uniref:uncharacterized protein LOC123311582 isoform X2 n=1 Tax=Coccinella septempunctata TaxID=41139 RepID=UPI001D08C042|nr:uncharacterized protein LOC123311582 isoform X2 [Coccinella septempunctata]
MAKGILGDTPQEFTEDRFEETTRVENTPSIKLRVIASYVILTLLSAYVIYDYRIRPDCICRPRPYVFAISAFGITGLYGLLGVLNRMNNKPCTAKGFNSLVYMLEMSIVLPLFASEVWALEKMFKQYPDMVHLHAATAVPGLANYFFQNEQKPWMMDASIAYSFSTLTYLGLAHGVIWVALAAVMYTLAYLYAERSQFMPRMDFIHDEEIINYCLSAFVLFSKQYLC